MSQLVSNEEQIATSRDGVNHDETDNDRIERHRIDDHRTDSADPIWEPFFRGESNTITSTPRTTEFEPALETTRLDSSDSESSEMLRWRADTLMDEMMSGSIVNGGDSSGIANKNLEGRANPLPTLYSDETEPVDMHAANGSQQVANAPAPGSQVVLDEIPVATPMQSNPWLFSAAERYRQNGYISSPPPPNPISASNGAHRNIQPVTNDNETQPIAANGYAPAYVPTNGTEPHHPRPNGVPSHSAPSHSVLSHSALSNGAPSHSTTPNGMASANGTPPESAQPAPLPSGQPEGMFSPMPGLGPVTRQSVTEETPPAAASAMRVGAAATQDSNNRSANTKNSNLLPRMSVLNVQSLQKEVLALEEEIDLILPSSHPGNDRAHHLLHKAYTILQNDIERSAEVEYYMQQVRSIIQRTRQMHRSSKTYNQNLALYLGSWFLLSLIILAAGYIYRYDIELWAVSAINLSADHPIFKHLIAFSTTLFAGSLGSAMGALYNMINYSRQSYGLFDRKYGLRGLILPIIGILFGTFIYLIWGLAGNFLQIDAGLNLFAGTLLALISFVFGMSQETIYGTRS